MKCLEVTVVVSWQQRRNKRDLKLEKKGLKKRQKGYQMLHCVLSLPAEKQCASRSYRAHLSCREVETTSVILKQKCFCCVFLLQSRT